MKVLIIPEDPTYDQYIVKPVIQRVMQDCELRAHVDVLFNPHIRGARQALKQMTIEGIISDYPMIDLLILVVDRDCDREDHSKKATARVGEQPDRQTCLPGRRRGGGLDVALHHRELRVRWSEVRSECDTKERFAEPLLDELGATPSIGRGRKKAMREIGRSWTGLKSRCPEINDLVEQVRAWSRSRA